MLLMNHEDDSWAINEHVRPLAAMFTTVVNIVAFLIEEMHLNRHVRCREPSIFQDLTRKKHMTHILRSGRV